MAVVQICGYHRGVAEFGGGEAECGGDVDGSGLLSTLNTRILIYNSLCPYLQLLLTPVWVSKVLYFAAIS